MEECKHEKVSIYWEGKKFACNDQLDCRKYVDPYDYTILTKPHVQLMQDVIEAVGKVRLQDVINLCNIATWSIATGNLMALRDAYIALDRGEK